ncbi:Mitochondrial substrate carrier family protein B, partial [Cucurbita argyrosperma subsp. sororia]
MQTEARVGVMMEGRQRALSSGHGEVVSVAPKNHHRFSNRRFGRCHSFNLMALLVLLVRPARRHSPASRFSFRDHMSANLLVHFLGGGLAGFTAASTTYPLDLVRTRLAAQGVGPNIAISFSVYESLRSFWQFVGVRGAPSEFAVTFPLDLVSRRKQLEGACCRARVYTTGLNGVFRHILRTEGFRGFCRGGILSKYYKVVPGVGICFMTYETLKSLLADTNG